MIGIFGNITNPNPKYSGTAGQGLFQFISNVFRFAATVAAIALVFQLILAGYGYISASGDAKKTELAWARIWQSLIGLLIIAAAFILAGIAERLTGIPILNPVIYGP